ncbi:MAG: DUF5333 domain-containing protein [Pseudomonadota bacterium]
MKKVLGAVLATLCLAVSAEAQTRVALADDAELEAGLTVVAIGDMIRKSCDGISARPIRAYAYIWDLESRARSLGYSRDEIEAYIDSRPDKARIEAKARDWIVARGGDPARPSTYCAVGRGEIAVGSTVGRLLKLD